MQTITDKDAAARLAVDLTALLKDRSMTYEQLASCYSIRHGHNVTQVLKAVFGEQKPMVFAEYLAQMSGVFEIHGRNQVRAAKRPAGGAGEGKEKSYLAANAPFGLKNGAVRAVAAAAAAGDQSAPLVMLKFSDVSRAVQNILTEECWRLPVDRVADLFLQKHGICIEDVVGMPVNDYFRRTSNIFEYCESDGIVCLQSSILAGPPLPDPTSRKDEAFVVNEFEQLIEAMGPIVYISALCGKFIQRNGISVTSVISARPLDLLKRHPSTFLSIGAGNVTLRKFEELPEVQRLIGKPSSKPQRVAKAAAEAQLPVPDVITEQHVVAEFRRMILADGADSVYMSSLCGRFLRRFKQPVTAIINCKPTEFLRRYPDVFVMTGGGNVGLGEVLGTDAVSVPPSRPPPKAPQGDRAPSDDLSAAAPPCEAAPQDIQLTGRVYSDIHSRVTRDGARHGTSQQLREICRQIGRVPFLGLEEVCVGGAAGEGLSPAGSPAEVVLFIRELPRASFARWLPHIVDTFVPVLQCQLSAFRAKQFRAEKDHLRLRVSDDTGGDVAIHLYVSPVFEGRADLLECIRASPPAERAYFSPAMSKARSDFVGRQPERVKVLVRLVMWWASRQRWSSALTRPSDWLIQLVVIHVCQQCKYASGPGDQHESQAPGVLDQVFKTLAGFDSIRILWEGTGPAAYSQQEIWRPLLSQEPLLMDPLNPYCNLAGADSFHAQELVAAAQPPGCLDCFRREAARFVPASEGCCAAGDGAGAGECRQAAVTR